LRSGNFLFHSSAHGPIFLSRRSGISRRTEDTAELSVQRVDMFLDRGSPFELVNRKVEWTHNLDH
jgi:hypothetical protein